MSLGIEKLAVYDDRVLQSRPKFSVNLGGLSYTNGKFRAISSSTSQLTFQANVPSQNVFIDRSIDIKADLFFQFQLTLGVAPTAPAPLVSFGGGIALCQLPLNSLISTAQATINDTTVSMNTSDVLREVLRFTDLPDITKQRTCPTMADVYLSYDDATNTNNNPLSDYTTAVTPDKVPNGAFYNVYFTTQAGAPILTTGTYNGVNYQNGIPYSDTTTGVGPYNLYFKVSTCEKLVLSPFIFADNDEYETGLFGIENINFTLNLQNPSLTGIGGRILRCASTNSAGAPFTITNLSFNTSPAQGAIQNAELDMIFITPPLGLSLPEASVVSYMNYPRYIDVASGLTAGTPTINTQTITLSNVPDYLVVYVKPTYSSPNQGDWYLPITNISINFDNYSGLLSSMTKEQLYHMSVKNGLQMDWNQWSGYGKKAGGSASSTTTGLQAGQVGLTGGFLIIKPGEDFGLSAGLAPSVLGQFTLQMTLQVDNSRSSPAYGPTVSSLPTSATVYTLAIESGFFESKAGQSRVVKSVLTQSDVIEAPLSMEAPRRSDLKRMVGGAMDFSSMLSKAKDIYDVARAVAPVVKPMLPKGAKSALDAVGLGVTGAGGASGGGRRMLSSRLM